MPGETLEVFVADGVGIEDGLAGSEKPKPKKERPPAPEVRDPQECNAEVTQRLFENIQNFARPPMLEGFVYPFFVPA